MTTPSAWKPVLAATLLAVPAVGLLAAPSGAPAGPEEAAPTWGVAEQTIESHQAYTATYSAYLPVSRVEGLAPKPRFPDPDLASGVWAALERFVLTHPPEEIYPGYVLQGPDPDAAGVELNLQRACGDFPDLPDEYGPGTHRAACYQWVADYLSLYHAARAYRAAQSGSSAPYDLAWAQAYLEASLQRTAPFVFGADDLAEGDSYRDTLAAVFQNTHRAVDLAIVVDLLRHVEGVTPDEQERAEDLLSGIARAWYSSIWQTGVQPSTGVTLTTRTSEDAYSYSLAGRQVMPSRAYTFSWDADKGNSPAEEAAWQGAGVVLAAHVLGSRLTDGPALTDAGTHFVEYAIAYDRYDPIRGGRVRTLNSETAPGPYGQNRYWIENHASDVPSLPYMAVTWHYIGASLLPDSSLVLFDPQDEELWEVLRLSAENTLHAPDGALLVDLQAGNGVGYSMADYTEWTMPCGQGMAGRLYVQAGQNPDGSDAYVSEIGHPAGFDVLMAGWPLLRLAAERRDLETYTSWRERLVFVIDEYSVRAPRLDWLSCKVASYVSDNPGYHWARMAATYVIPYLGLSGYEVESWHPR